MNSRIKVEAHGVRSAPRPQCCVPVPPDNSDVTSRPATSRAWTPEPPTVPGWLRHHSRNPLVVVCFLAALVFIAWRLPKSPPDDSLTVHWTTRGYRWVEAHWNSARPKPPVNIGPRRDFAHVYLRVENGSTHVLPLEDLSWDGVQELVAKYPLSHFVSVGYVHQVHRKGLWYPWLEMWLVRVTTTPFGNDARALPEDVVSVAVAAAAEHVKSEARVRRAIAAGGATGSRIVPHRILINLTSIVLVVLVVRGVVTHRAWRGQRRWRRGMCPMCSYPIVGMPVVDGSRTCPECGVSAPAVELPAPPMSR